MSRLRQVLFLCTGNSCRSQMAEAITNHFAAASWHASSAGTKPAGYVHPLAFEVLREIGIEHAGRSKSVEEFRGKEFDLVITVCGDAEENCPLWLGKGKRHHIGFTDPAKVSGSTEEVLGVFRSVRDDMHKRILGYLQQVE
jgi:arsenate reductase (thioredoxin)